MEITSKTKTANKLRRKNTQIALSFIAPNFIDFFLFTLIPVICLLISAFMSWDFLSTPESVGVKNFTKVIHNDTFWISLEQTSIYTIGVASLALICSLGLAILLSRKIRGMKFFRTVFFFPYVTSLVAIAVVRNMLFHPAMGPINQFLRLFIENPPGWISSSTWALPAIIIVNVWRFVGYYMISYLTGLQSVLRELYEVASMDGAGKWNQFLNVTLPSLRPTTFFVTIMLAINCFKVSDLAQVTTGGGPGRATNVLVYEIHNEAFVKFNFGYVSVITMVLFIIVLAITVAQFKQSQHQEKVQEEKRWKQFLQKKKIFEKQKRKK